MADYQIFDCRSRADIEKSIASILDQECLPDRPGAKFLVKPNLNNEMNALLGGTTDLRILYAVVKYLRGKGYADITIGDGPNTGAFNGCVDVFRRLAIDKIADKFGARWIDFNHAICRSVRVCNRSLRIPEVIFQADYMINLPKIKTHVEAGMSVCAKNLVGCVSGFDKRKMHASLDRMIYEINTVIRPDLHIIDALVIMEGDGPSAGWPRLLNKIVSGHNPFILDHACENLIGMDSCIGYFKYWPAYRSKSRSAPRACIHAKPAKQNIFQRLLMRNFFVLPRYWKIFSWFFSIQSVHKLLLALKIRQTPFDKTDAAIEYMEKRDACSGCGICDFFCPENIRISELDHGTRIDCLNCLYCYIVCPENAIAAQGTLGFNQILLNKYRHHLQGEIDACY